MITPGLHKTWYPGNGVTSQSKIWQPKWLAGPPAFSNPGSQVGCQPSQPVSSNLVANLFKMMQPMWLAGRACGRLNYPLVNATTKSLWGGFWVHQEPWPLVSMWINAQTFIRTFKMHIIKQFIDFITEVCFFLKVSSQIVLKLPK